MKVTLSLTHRCNLSCEYCYSGRKLSQDMSEATAQEIVDLAINMTPPGQRIEFGFFGGEPLLRFDLIKRITGYIREKEQETGTPVSLGVTTNGTLLTEPILDFFREEGVGLCISLDGPAHIHDQNRCYRDGRGSFRDVARNLGLALERLGKLQVNAVYGPNTIDSLPNTILFLTRLGVSAIHVNPDILTPWGESTCAKLRETYMQVANGYIQSYERGQEIAVNLIDSKIILLLKGGYEDRDKCGMGETEWGFAPSGDIYPCERFVTADANPPLHLGNIRTGLDQTRLSSLLKHRGNRNEECRACEFQGYCMNWCGCTNYYMTGYTDLVSQMMCESEKAAIRAAKEVLISLRSNSLFLDHFMKYLPKGRHYQ